MRELLRALPPHQVRLVRAEDWHSQPKVILYELFSFLGLSPRRSVGHEQDDAGHADLNKAVDSFQHTHLESEADAAVRGFYDELNVELSQLAGGDSRFLYK